MTRRHRPGLVGRVVALVVLACVVTAGLGLAISVPIVTRGTGAAARTRLSDLADLASRTALRQDRSQTRAALGALGIRVVLVDAAGAVTSTTPKAEQAVTPATARAVRQGRSVSTTGVFDGHPALVEGRPLADGAGIVLVQRTTDAGATGRADLVRTLWALLAAVVVTVAVGAVVARRVLRPLRRTTAAAHDLAAGRRDVFVPTDGPAETAELAAAFNHLTGALTRSEGRQREFLLSVSHDLRTPLAAITGYAESLRTGVVTGRVADEFVVGIEAEAARLHRMVDDLLDLARLQAEDVRVDLRPVDLTALVTDTGRAWSARCAAAGLVLRAPVPGVPVWGLTDAARLRQVLDLLLDNAVRVCPPGAPVVLELRPPEPASGWAAVVDVRDGGPGLTDDDLVVAFERGVLRDRYAASRAVGTGLGLAVVRSVATRLGLGLDAGHAPEGGARFTLLVPRDLPARPDSPRWPRADSPAT